MAELRVPIEAEFLDEIGVIRYLLDEIEEERRYNEAYDEALARAENIVEHKGGHVWEYMDGFPHEPRQSVIKDDLKMIRRLTLKIERMELTPTA